MTRSAHRYPEQLHLDSPRGHVARSPIRTPSGRSTQHSRSSHLDDSISYPDMLSGSLTKVHKPCYVIPDLLMAKDFKASVLHVSELSICFSMDSKELSSILDCFGDQKANKNTKTYTI
ncbi:hypothetical protein VitviT2T_004036 [Vitis vinifera]|uniref:Uncharacterized protein n=1 Tax=Vitis vinifera TaxID=29760 RepID=A0ABY9BNC5_VITVI|nr:hypothetical protein VitviT2T_004036 [Vitis vinifera]